MTDTPAIHARGLTRRFGKVIAANSVDLDVPRGEIYGFLGPNGSGKTTIIRMLCGLLTPTAGELKVLGLEIPAQTEVLRHKIGYMTQKFSLYDDLTVRENMVFLARIYGLSSGAIRGRVGQLLDRYALTPMRDRLAGEMSGGQRQRLALAAATLHQPTLLILDEPTSAVDPENRRDFWEKLFDLVDDGATILVSTHYMDEAERCHQLAILETGELRANGPPGQLMAALQGRVIEVSGEGLRQVKSRVMALPGVQSAAQQGLQLRVLLGTGHSDPLAYLQQALGESGLGFEHARPSLEDVFVASTTHRGQA